MGTREVAQQLRAFAVLAEEPSSVPSTHFVVHYNLYNPSFKGSNAFL